MGEGIKALVDTTPGTGQHSTGNSGLAIASPTKGMDEKSYVSLRRLGPALGNPTMQLTFPSEMLFI